MAEEPDHELNRDTQLALAALPGQIVGLSKSVDRLWTELDKGEAREDRRVTLLHDKLERQGDQLADQLAKLSETVNERFDRIDADHAATLQAAQAAQIAGGEGSLKSRIALFLTVATGLGLPIALAVIAKAAA